MRASGRYIDPWRRQCEDRQQMMIAANCWSSSYCPARHAQNQFPAGQDILDGSLTLSILPNQNGAPVSVRLLQIDIAVKD